MQIFYTGIVEDRIDPLKIGRCKVRIHGIHNPDKVLLPTDDLPWGIPIQGVTSAAVNGIGFSPTGIMEGSTVVVAFADNESKQIPLILGTIAGIGKDKATTPNNGFSPPPDGIDEKFSGKSEIPQLGSTEIEEKDLDNREKFEVYSGIKSIWEAPTNSYNASYPYNKAFVSESGHSLEFDDTPEHQRVRLKHTEGSQIEYQPDGSMVHRVVKDNFQIIIGDDYAAIKGNCSLTVEGNIQILCDSNVEVVSNKNIAFRVKGNFGALVDGNIALVSKGDMFLNTEGNLVLQGKTIQENSDGFAMPNDLLPALEITAIDEAMSEFDEPEVDPGMPQEKFESLNKRSENTDFQGVAGEEDTTPPADESKAREEVNTICDLTGTSPETKLGGGWTIGDLTTKAVFAHRLQAQRGLSEQQIACNLKYLVENILIPLQEKYGRRNIQINSGFRRGSGKSQHELGEAVDLVFRNAKTQADYDAIFKWIRDNLQFDQLIKERGRQPWLHVSATSRQKRKQTLTRIRPGVYKPGLFTIR